MMKGVQDFEINMLLTGDIDSLNKSEKRCARRIRTSPEALLNRNGLTQRQAKLLHL